MADPNVRRTRVTTTHGPHVFEVFKKYRIIKCIGSGAYGIVVSAQDEETSRKVAIKKVPKAFDDVVDGKRILRELQFLRSFRHENVVGIVDLQPPRSVAEFDDIYIMTDLMDTDLHKIIYSRQKLSEDHIQYFVYQILRALKYLHSAGVLHRDLKPANILVNQNCDLKICDFGLARVMDDNVTKYTEYVVTRWYRAPEIMLACARYTPAVDMWSVGCIMAELLGSKPLFPGDDYKDQLRMIVDKLGSPEEDEMHFIGDHRAREFMVHLPHKPKVDLGSMFPDTNADAIDLLQRMLHFDPDRRISVTEALVHPYLATLHSEEDEPEAGGKFEFSFVDRDDIGVDKLRELMFQEVQLFHPDAKP